MLSLQDMQKLMQPLRNRVMLMVARGVLKMTNDKGGLQTAQISLLEDELRDKVERVQDYGFTGNPLPGAEAITLFVGGNRDHGLIIKVDDRRYRLKALKGGEVAMYTDEGDFIHMKRDRNIEVKSLHVVVNADEDYTVNTKAHTVNCETHTVNASKEIDMTTAKTGIHTDGLAFTSKDGGEVEAAFTGGIKATQDVKSNAGAVSLNGHVHDGVQPGNSTTAKPVGG